MQLHLWIIAVQQDVTIMPETLLHISSSTEMTQYADQSLPLMNSTITYLRSHLNSMTLNKFWGRCIRWCSDSSLAPKLTLNLWKQTFNISRLSAVKPPGNTRSSQSLLNGHFLTRYWESILKWMAYISVTTCPEEDIWLKSIWKSTRSGLF